jgi:outer membrane putative beta-barrel porin/alpha-amylase
MRSSFSRAVIPALVLGLGTALAAAPGASWADSSHGNGPLADTHAPAGVMFDHMHKAGGFMIGFRYAYTSASGDMQHGSHKASDQEVIDNGCTPHPCSMAPSDMAMNMYMLDIMYAPTDWMTIMVMPMYMSHDMTMRPLKSSMSAMGHMEHMGMDMDGMMGHGTHGGHMSGHSHGTDGWGDTIFGPELKIADGPGYHLQFAPMFSAPTGNVDYKMNGAFTHYMMQLGSGTWDFIPSITYTGRADQITWGAQALGVVRLENENDSGYLLGDVFQATGWGSYRFANWISASIRGLYTEQGRISGHYNGAHNHSSPPDLQFNYGGRFWDIGFGINTVVPGGTFKGLRLSAEWLQPVGEDVKGYQLERDGTLWANASMAF